MTSSGDIILPRLNLPPFAPQLRRGGRGEVQIFDPLRRRWLVLTPEEHVRQAFTAHLISSLGYPAGLMANEVSLTLNSTSRRCDTVLFDRERHPLMIIEYKAPSVGITRKVFDQIVRYNMVLRARWLIVSNGLRHYCCRVDYDTRSVEFLPGIPPFEAL